MKVLCCLWVSNSCGTPIKHKMKTKPWYVQIQHNWPFFFTFMPTILNIGFSQKYSHLTARQNKSRPGAEIFRKLTQVNNIFFRLSGKTTGKLFSYEQSLRIRKDFKRITQFIIFKPLRYCFKETIGFDVTPRLQVVHSCV